jgi:hypothetical protein
MDAGEGQGGRGVRCTAASITHPAVAARAARDATQTNNAPGEVLELLQQRVALQQRHL